MDFCMGFAGAFVPTFANNDTIAHQYATDARIGTGGVKAALRQAQCLSHPYAVLCYCHNYFVCGLRRAGDLRTSSTASVKSPTS